MSRKQNIPALGGKTCPGNSHPPGSGLRQQEPLSAGTTTEIFHSAWVTLSVLHIPVERDGRNSPLQQDLKGRVSLRVFCCCFLYEIPPHSSQLHPSFSLFSPLEDFLTLQLSQRVQRAGAKNIPDYYTFPAESWVSRAGPAPAPGPAPPGRADLPSPGWEFTPCSKQTKPKSLPALSLVTHPAEPTLGKSSRFP